MVQARVFQEPLNFCHTSWRRQVRGTAYSGSQVGDGSVSPGLHQYVVGWIRVRCKTKLQDVLVMTAFTVLFLPQ